jgi:2-keto-4-pentenoate hydratase
MYDEWSAAVDLRAQAAERLIEAERTGKPGRPVRDLIGTSADGYAVQELLTRHALAEGRRPVGRKIALTNLEVQRRFGAAEPAHGLLYADRARLDGGTIALADLMQPRVEAEVAFVLGADLEGGPYTAADVIRAVDFVLPAIDIADTRVADWDLTLPDLIADNAAAGLFVLGSDPRDPRTLDLGAAAMTMTRNGKQVSTGIGAQCLGHPLNALVWLANRTSTPLLAGDVVLTGTIGEVAIPVAGDEFEVRIDGLSVVRAVFA